MTTYSKPKDVHTNVVMMTPDAALRLLENAAENRNINPDRVAAYKQMIERGEWRVTHQGICVGKDGKLYDGQHRLWAIATSGLTVPINVTEGVEADAREAIDKGRSRSVSDELKMFRGLTNVSARVAFTKQCAKLYSGGHGGVQMPTLSIFEDWYDCFKDGVDWAVATFVSAGAPNAVKKASVGGSLAFAYPTNPKKLAEFGEKLATGIGLEAGDPALALRKMLFEGQHAKRGLVANAPAETARKVLRTAHFSIRGETITKVQDSEAGLKYFGKFYADSRKLKGLIAPFKAAAGDETMNTDKSVEAAMHALAAAKKSKAG